ncbi:MAG: ParA family protein [Chloroflexota bacterium]
MARILAIANQKGGVGKTTTVLNLGAVLAQKQCRVLLVDLDPQASLTVFLGLDPYRIERSTYSLLMHPDMPLSRILKPLGSANAFLPGSVDLAAATVKLGQGLQPLDRLRTALRQGHLEFDYVLVDTSPGLNALTVAGLLAADEVLLPTQCNHSAMLGIRAVQDVIKRIRENMGNPSLKITGVLPTFYDATAVYAPDVLAELHALLPGMMFETVVPYDTNIADAPHKGQIAVDYAPNSPGALAYHALADELLSR